MTLITNKIKLKSELDRLILHTKDSVNGYEKAADLIEETHPIVAAEWRAVAASRGAQAEKLNQRLKCMGEDPNAARGSLEGAVHRGLISVKEMFASNDFKFVVQEAIRGEEKLIGYIHETFEDLSVID